MAACNKMSSSSCLRLFLLLMFSATAVFSGTIVKTLPGFDGELPFKLETGYVRVGTSEVFYYFIESEGNPKQDPLLLWYSGGPGCSALNGLVYEIGPLAFNITDYEGGMPSLMYYPYSWTKTASILFVDAPVGTGFSFALTPDGFATSDTLAAREIYQFLRKWLMEHPQYLKLQLFVGADSYSGISATMVVQHVLDGNLDKNLTQLNLKGYILGCPEIDGKITTNEKMVFTHRIGLISDELYNATRDTCGGDYYDTTSENPACYENLKLIDKCTKDIYKNNILEPKCTWASPESNEPARQLLEENSEGFILSPPRIPEFWCRNFNYALSYIWANDQSVRNALNIREGTVPDWKRCNKTLNYERDVSSVLDYHRNFTNKGLQALVYNGDHDLIIPNTATQGWIGKLNLTIVNDWRPWLVDGQVAGYTTKYSENGYRLTYATVKGGGHTPQESKRRECYEMFERFIHYYPL
ncbi:serine carboxypeptidase-like 16 [Mangifera indica]|uniref:serine carboxypeptidase-like 16 n=1 Tax=Mangifera indica TaxID=29780 RepID=UPI001CFB688E|nr:serine carboxypeptidase-like 16 [Mangifera indica]